MKKPQTVKGQYEVLRCYHILATRYSERINEMLLVQMKNNNERDRVKSLLVFTQLTNTSSDFVSNKIDSFLDILKQMIAIEKSIKMKQTLLKTVVALAQKSFVKEKEFICSLYVTAAGTARTMQNTEP